MRDKPQSSSHWTTESGNVINSSKPTNLITSMEQTTCLRESLPKPTQKETNYLHKLISILKIEIVSLCGFTDVCYQTFKEKIMPILYNLFQEIETEGILPNSFCKVGNTLI